MAHGKELGGACQKESSYFLSFEVSQPFRVSLEAVSKNTRLILTNSINEVLV